MEKNFYLATIFPIWWPTENFLTETPICYIIIEFYLNHKFKIILIVNKSCFIETVKLILFIKLLKAKSFVFKLKIEMLPLLYGKKGKLKNQG